jgi:NTE family protein
MVKCYSPRSHARLPPWRKGVRNLNLLEGIQYAVGITCSNAAHLDSSAGESPRRALVLSGGGMFGAYQAGVWDVLHQSFTPDIVVGASVGSLNGYLIAAGIAPDELVARWQKLDDVQKVRWRFSTRLSRGLIDAAILESWIQDICRSCSPRCDYALVVTETRTGRQRMFRWPDLTWMHLAASCGVPGFLPTYRIDGVHYCDGGLIDPLPLWAALELGATEIVSINVMNQRPLPVRAVVRVLRAYSRYEAPVADRATVIPINPTERLGAPRDAVYWSRSNADRWIELGRKDALEALSRLNAGTASTFLI